MPKFTVLIPTHDHADTLRYAIASVQWQTCQDFELFVVGDGVPDRSRELLTELAADDARIRFFDFPKGERHGEANRHLALQEARGEFVAYQSDDDLWLPTHLASMAALLDKHDLVHCMQMEILPDGQIRTGIFDALADPQGLEKMQSSTGGFGLGSGAHRLDAYHRLPLGWHPAPAGINTDLHFWLQFLQQDWCRYHSYKWPNLLHLSSASRKDWSVDRRAEELKQLWQAIQSHDQRDAYLRACLEPMHDRLLKTSFHPARSAELAAAIASMTAQMGAAVPEVASYPRYPLGARLQFQVDSPADRFLLSGFWPAEAWGRWAAGQRADVVLPLSAPVEATLRLELVLRTLLNPTTHPVSMFTVQVNGWDVLTVHETRPGIFSYSVNLPKHAYCRSSVLVVTLLTEKPVRPNELGINGDMRLLGAGLVSLRLTKP